jgi:four helix bundle protein
VANDQRPVTSEEFSSIPANIAEGFGKRTTRDFLRHLDIAAGSLEETRYFFEIAEGLEVFGSGTAWEASSDLR